jgi:small neutral amino acid transporter SnatA (MarC family)
MGQNSYGNEHGNTPAAWTAAIIVLVAFIIGALAVMWENWLLFWVGGVGLAVIGAIVGKVMQMMGLGQQLPAEQESSSVPTTADRDE